MVGMLYSNESKKSKPLIFMKIEDVIIKHTLSTHINILFYYIIHSDRMRNVNTRV